MRFRPCGAGGRACRLPSFECQSNGLERASEHPVVVRGGLGHVLDHVPVFDDLAVLESEEIGQRPTRIFWVLRFEIEVSMGATKSPSAITRLMSSCRFGYSPRSHLTKPMNASGPSFASGLC